MADTNSVPNRKVGVGAAVGGLITFVAIVCKTSGYDLEAAAWLGLQTALVFGIQYVVPNAEA